MPRRAIGIVRVSQVAGREGESFVSPKEQGARIRAACERDGLVLVETIEELDVSGGTPLDKREGLRAAIEAIEDGSAEVIVAAYFDRLVRSLRVQDELVSRVEKAGGQVLALDVGAVSSGSAGQWLSGTMLGAVSEYMRRSAKERAGAAQARAVARGVAPWPNLPPGYERDAEGRLVANDLAPVVVEGFTMRANGATIKDIRAFLTSHGIVRSYHGVQSMLESRVYLGEIHFGKLVNLDAHPPIVERSLWQAVQDVRVSRGRRPKSERLLARLGVLRCGTCGGRMVVGSANNRGYAVYRCSPVGDCPNRMAISATISERAVSDAVRAALANVKGRASVESDAREAEAAAEKAQADLDAAIRAFSALTDEPAAVERLAELRRVRDEAVEQAQQLRGLRSALSVDIAGRWDDLTVAEQRGFIADVVERADVGPGRGAGRISVKLFGQ